MNKDEYKNFQVTVVSLPDREFLVSEIFYQGEQWVEISQETGIVMVQFYNRLNGQYWEFPFNTALEILNEAKARLMGK